MKVFMEKFKKSVEIFIAKEKIRCKKYGIFILLLKEIQEQQLFLH